MYLVCLRAARCLRSGHHHQLTTIIIKYFPLDEQKCPVTAYGRIGNCLPNQTIYLIREFEVRLISLSASQSTVCKLASTFLILKILWRLAVQLYSSTFENMSRYHKKGPAEANWRTEDTEGAWPPLAGDKSGQLLNADRLPGVQQVIHVPDGLLARRLCWSGVVGFILSALLLRCVFVFTLEGRLPGCWIILLVLVQDTDTAVLSYSVADLSRVDPHGQLAGKNLVEELWRQATVVTSLTDHGVHLAIDSDASVPGAFEWLLGEPVVAVPSAENLYQGIPKFLQLSLAYISFTQTYEMDQKIRGGLNF